MNYALPSPSPPQSPSSSVGAPDTTTHAERALSDQAFARRAEDALQLHIPRDRPRANDHVLLPRPKTQAEERRMHEEAMAKLRQHVAQLDDEELFETVSHLQRGGRPGTEPQPTSSSIHAIIAGTMNVSLRPHPQSRKSATPSRSVSTAHASTVARSSVPRQIR
ncbi:hypothetical protein EXIGLDRAFT_835624 [Exidia glandulosa HHB12029]|uniref:Uncharacterized protein n=1 Tax=Exidia glandulosa HHB12029 TaxID=1314781 RepID=A0A165IL77_EXIGL|nr:hypothetical protein EXIGLDRAFT_835624 [Exidia glandulosa HHB12029]